MKTYLYALVLVLIVLLAIVISNANAMTTASTQLANQTPGVSTTSTAKTSAFSTDYRLQGPPTVSAAFINQVLAAYHSPAAGTGQQLHDLGVQAGIDPVYALAFFLHESRFGTTGEARTTLSLGNERCIPDRPCIDQARGGYAQMRSWVDGYAHWYSLIQAYASGEIERELTGHSVPLLTVAEIIPVYAPSSDHNDEQAYIAAIIQAVNSWRAGRVIV